MVCVISGILKSLKLKRIVKYSNISKEFFSRKHFMIVTITIRYSATLKSFLIDTWAYI